MRGVELVHGSLFGVFKCSFQVFDQGVRPCSRGGGACQHLLARFADKRDGVAEDTGFLGLEMTSQVACRLTHEKCMAGADAVLYAQRPQGDQPAFGLQLAVGELDQLARLARLGNALGQDDGVEAAVDERGHFIQVAFMKRHRALHLRGFLADESARLFIDDRVAAQAYDGLAITSQQDERGCLAAICFKYVVALDLLAEPRQPVLGLLHEVRAQFAGVRFPSLLLHRKYG